ncbi:MAG: stalk domain-containing protein [Natronincolaceae bacterium]|nr:hypothetical protein [Clostridiales bacterium]
MKKKMNRKIAVSVIAVLIFSLVFGAVVFADGNFQTLKAWFGNLSIYRNNQYVQLSDKPFIVDGRTYVPLRAISELFNKEVGWDGVNYRIDLNDKPDENLVHLTQQLIEAQVKAQELEAKVAQLEAELKTKVETDKKDDIRDLESYLNKQHGTYKGVRFDIDLYKSKNDIDVDIYVDLGYDDYKWNSLSTSNIKDYLQGIVDDILYNYKNASVEGYIKDSSTTRNNVLASFYTKANGTVVVDTDYRWDYDRWYDDLDDLEYYLNRNYDSYYSYYGYVYFDIELYGDKNDIRVYITNKNDDLDDLTASEIRDYLKEIYSEIIWEFPNAYVDGYIKDYYTRYDFEFDYWGYLDLW